MMNELLRFKRVVEAGSISKASRLLFVSQPALSKSIRLLEDHYGVILLERHAAGVRPTASGNVLYDSACEMERCLLSIEERLLRETAAHEPRQHRKKIRIGCSTIWNDFLLPEVSKTIETIDTYEIHVTSGTSEQLLDDLLEDQRYDFVLCRILEEERFRPLHSIPLFESRPAVFISEHHPILTRTVDTEQLGKLKWVKLTNLPGLRERDLTPAGKSLLPEDFFSSSISFEVEDLMAAVQLLHDNHAILLPLALADVLKSYNIRPLPFPSPITASYWLGMVYSSDHNAALHVRDLMNKIRLHFL
jgi:DNA-binding transcriptional LysR family regulator